MHARGFGAHGYFQTYKSQADLTKANFLQDPAAKTPAFVRFSTVADKVVAQLVNTPAAVDWVRDAFGHLEVIGFQPEAAPLFKAARVPLEGEGLITLADAALDTFIAAAKQHRIWSRELLLEK